MRLKLIFALFVLTCTSAFANDWPTRPVTIVLSFPAGGAVDSVTRTVAEQLGSKLGQRFIVENRPGAQGNLGTGAVAKAAADGYTLLMGTSSTVTNRYLYQSLPFDSETAFSPIVLVANTPLIIAGSKKLPVQDFKGVLEYVKANPGKVTTGTTGVGSQGHIIIGLLNKRHGASITHVPYRDYPKMIPDMMSGDLQLGMILMPFFVPQIREGQLAGMAVASNHRSHAVPDVPSFQDLGLSEYVSTGWFGLMAPAGTPREIVEKISDVVNDYVKSDAGSKLLRDLSMEPVGGTSESFTAYLKSEYSRWAPIIKESGIQVQ